MTTTTKITPITNETTQPVVSTTTIANGIVKGYFKLVGILLLIGLGIGVVWVVIAAVGNIAAHTTSINDHDSVEAFTKQQQAKAPHQLYEESSHYHSVTGLRFLSDVSLYQNYNSSPDFEKPTHQEFTAADALDSALNKLAQAKTAGLSADLIAKAQQRVTDGEGGFDRAVADHNAAYAAEQKAKAQKAKDDLVRDLSSSDKPSHSIIVKKPIIATAAISYPECAQRDHTVGSDECNARLKPNAPIVAACSSLATNDGGTQPEAYRLCAVKVPTHVNDHAGMNYQDGKWVLAPKAN
jgi:hypothetical protein